MSPKKPQVCSSHLWESPFEVQVYDLRPPELEHGFGSLAEVNMNWSHCIGQSDGSVRDTPVTFSALHCKWV